MISGKAVPVFCLFMPLVHIQSLWTIGFDRLSFRRQFVVEGAAASRRRDPL